MFLWVRSDSAECDSCAVLPPSLPSVSAPGMLGDTEGSGEGKGRKGGVAWGARGRFRTREDDYPGVPLLSWGSWNQGLTLGGFQGDRHTQGSVLVLTHTTRPRPYLEEFINDP